jgi:hypothetical protein
MKKFKLILSILLLSFNYSIFAQNAFIVESPGTSNNFKFYVPNKIKLKTKTLPKPFRSDIREIRDSMLILKNNVSVNLNEIEIVYKENRGAAIISKILIPIGLIFAPLDILNNVINKDKPIVRTVPLVVSGVCLSAGLLISLDRYRPFKIDNKKWRVKIIDKSSLIK